MPEPDPTTHFIRKIIAEDLDSGKQQQVVTRFPPEPNGYLHIGHAKSIFLNFGMAEAFGGHCNLRFDDTNPEKEEAEYAYAIEEDVRWLGYQWQNLCHASDYFDRLHDYAICLIRNGYAYVDSQDSETIRNTRGTLTEPGADSPYRDRSIRENLDLFARMRAGEFPEGAHVLRARIRMDADNINMRDPVLYRIRRQRHHRTGNAWSIYPMYDFTHCLSDAIEGITHSLCTLEFEDHRPLYDWFLHRLDTPCHPQQIEFSRLFLEYTVVSKRLLQRLIRDGHVDGWDDPRLPTLRGLRRRGYTPASIRRFCQAVGVTKKESRIAMNVLEDSIREDLNAGAPRLMAVLDPLRVVLTNYPEGQTEQLEAPNHPNDPAFGTREVPFGRELYIERADFMEDPPKKYFRLAPGREVRLRYAYFITCQDIERDADGRITALHCTYDPDTRGGDAPDGRKVRGTLHWVSAAHAVPACVRLYDRLFKIPDPAAAPDLLEALNEHSRIDMDHCRIEPEIRRLPPRTRLQFERQGYFCQDTESAPDRLIFNRTVSLRDSWAKLSRRL